MVLTNITYTGNLLLQKEFIEDPITKHRKKNRGEMPQYFVENTHELIIDMETFQYVQDEIARRKELGALANKSLNTCCFTGKIKCPHCGVSYMHNKRTDRGGCLEFWSCGSSKKKGGHCEIGGSINHENLKKVCAEVFGLEEFDEEIFLREADHIDVPKRYVLEFYMADGRVITNDCPNTGHKDCWTAEYRAKTSAKRKKNGTKCKGSSCFTGKIKCKSCGCNFRRATQPSATAESGKVNYWRCSEHSNGCETAGLREDALIPLLADALEMAEFDRALFRKTVEYISVLTDTDLEIHKKDGTVRYSGVSIFSNKIKCAECGSWYGSKVWHSNDKYRRVIYRCNHKFDGNRKCETPHVTEEEIIAAFIKAMNTVITERDEIIANIQLIRQTVCGTADLEEEQDKLRSEMEIVVELTQGCVAENARTAQNQEDYQKRYDSLVERYEKVKSRYDAIVEAIEEKQAHYEKLGIFIEPSKSMENLSQNLMPECGAAWSSASRWIRIKT